jgi:hypothetical protein
VLSLLVKALLIRMDRQKLLEILNSGQYASPIIVFVNQKKTADMVAKDLSRAGVCNLRSKSHVVSILTEKVVECSDPAFGQESRAKRGIAAVAAQRGIGRAGCDGSGWARH